MTRKKIEQAFTISDEDYKQRLKAEYEDLRVRFNSLEWWLANKEGQSVSAEYRKLLQSQLEHMGQLLLILQQRAALDGIELDFWNYGT